jgi:hypothetical protein
MKDLKNWSWFLCGALSVRLSMYFLTLIHDYQTKEQIIETQKQTIERLNNQLSKMDTLHDECFKVSEIRKNK